MTTEIKTKLCESDLRQFTGSEHLYRHFLGGFQYTDGVRYLAEKGSAFWLIDAIASYQPDKRIRRDPMLREFQLWTIHRDGSGASLWLRRDSGPDQDVVIKQTIEWTDFPLDKLTLYVENGVLCLPSER